MNSSRAQLPARPIFTSASSKHHIDEQSHRHCTAESASCSNASRCSALLAIPAEQCCAWRSAAPAACWARQSLPHFRQRQDCSFQPAVQQVRGGGLGLLRWCVCARLHAAAALTPCLRVHALPTGAVQQPQQPLQQRAWPAQQHLPPWGGAQSLRAYSQCDCPTLGGPEPDLVVVEYDEDEVDR